MKIRTQDGRVFEGTSLQVVRGMRDSNFFHRGKTVREYVEAVVDQTLAGEEVILKPAGETDEELAGSLVDELFRAGLAVEL